MLMQLNPKNTNLTFWPQNSPFQSNFRSGVNPIKLFGINYIRINVIQGKIQLVESISNWYGRPNPEDRKNRKPKDRIFDRRTE